MNKILPLTIILLLMQGCSFLVDLAFFNNSDEEIKICNLNLKEPSCQTIEPKTLEKVLLVGDMPKESWQISIAAKGNIERYEFKFDYSEHASDVYCEGFLPRRCDIPVQYETNGLLYWSGKSEQLPVVEFPKQPNGFPVKPSAQQDTTELSFRDGLL